MICGQAPATVDACGVAPSAEPAGGASLARRVHAAVIEDDVVLLDVLGDRYFCLPSAAGLPGADWRAGRPGRDEALIAELREAGLVEDGPSVARPAWLVRPTAEAAIGGAVRLRDVARLVVEAVVDYLFQFRGKSFAILLEAAACGRPANVEACVTPELLAEVARLRHALRFAPVPRKCLTQSFLLLRLLRRRGHDATWVIAVRVWPFAAHCWLQVGETVLDEHWERLDAFEPILAV